MAYFDNAATTFPKPDQVYSFMDEFYRKNGGNAGRGSYDIAASAKGIIDDTRTRLKTMLKCPSKEIIFEPTATISLNIIIQGMIAKGVRDIYVSPFEHNAVTRVLHHYAKKDVIRVHVLTVTEQLDYDLNAIKYQFDKVNPDFVIVSHASNVIGLVAPIEKLFLLAKEYQAFTLVDMSQTAGLVETNVGLETVDFAVFAGHKTLLGPTGVSGFAMKTNVQPEPILFGGTGYDSANQDMPESLPEKYEMGTVNTVGIAGLNASLQWISQMTMDSLYNAEAKCRKRLLDLLSKYDYLTIIGNNAEKEFVGIVSCLFRGISSDSAGSLLSKRGISVRTGLHCAPYAHKWLGTYPAGTVRFSVNSMTTDSDFKELEDVLDEIAYEL